MESELQHTSWPESCGFLATVERGNMEWRNPVRLDGEGAQMYYEAESDEV